MSAAVVGAVGVPVNAGEASGARDVSVGWTWSPREYLIETPGDATPSINGFEVEGTPPLFASTKASVAINVLLSPGGCVTAVVPSTKVVPAELSMD